MVGTDVSYDAVGMTVDLTSVPIQPSYFVDPKVLLKDVLKLLLTHFVGIISLSCHDNSLRRSDDVTAVQDEFRLGPGKMDGIAYGIRRSLGVSVLIIIQIWL